MSGLENVKRLYLDYLNAGFKKDVIVRKLKAQFKDAKFTFKGATLYVAFGLNQPVKVLGGVQLNAATRLMASRPEEKAIGQKFADELKKHGIQADISFTGPGELAVEIADKLQFEKAKGILKKVGNMQMTGEDHDPELGFIAWYKF